MKTVFVGNRFGVLEQLLDGDYAACAVFAVAGSVLESELINRHMKYTPVGNRAQLIDALAAADYDLLVSNGCPYLLPISQLDNGRRTFVNIHPALLPEQRGPHAINSVMLHQYGAGATCHLMDDSADTGPVIARKEIPFSEDLDLGLLYQLSFSAEVDAFSRAEARGFKPLEEPPRATGVSRFYQRSEQDMVLDLDADLEEIYRRIRAFGVASQGAVFRFSGKTYRVLDAEIITNPYLLSKTGEYRQNELVCVYGDSLLMRKGPAYIKLKSIAGDLSGMRPGVVLT